MNMAPIPNLAGPVRYPSIKVKLLGEDSNAFNVLGRVRDALRRAFVPQSEIDEFMKEAMSNNHDHLLATCMKWVEIE